ncbi:MAG: hypothetical protein HC801_11360 [Nitrospira sp.]|nr:hypothetical protein [Nitrospira sp.]
MITTSGPVPDHCLYGSWLPRQQVAKGQPDDVLCGWFEFTLVGSAGQRKKWNVGRRICEYKEAKSRIRSQLFQ